jgi:hypothetical protein
VVFEPSAFPRQLLAGAGGGGVFPQKIKKKSSNKEKKISIPEY